jgi:methionyl-tRNA formyltransferase
MQAVFVGAVEGSRVALEALIEAGRTPELVVTLADDVAHRHSDFADLTSPARAAGCKVLHVTDINAPGTLDAIRAVKPDLCMVIGWSQICREPFREIARIGNIGFHPAPLPQLRGRAVIPWTILTNQLTTGSTLFWLDEGVDSGDILLQRTFDLAPEETARTLYQKHLAALKELLPEALALVESGTARRIAQDHSLATYCAKRTADDGLIDWREPAKDILRLVRAVGDPYPGAFTHHKGERLVIDAAAPFPRSDRYIGLAGQVQCHTDEGFLVLCGDGICIEVTQWRCTSEGRPRVHVKLGGTDR